MANKTIMLACAAGMSTSLLVKRMQDAASSDGIEAKIFAVPAAEIQDKLASEHPDVLMLGPQVRYMKADLKDKLDIPVDVINMQDYGLMKGEAVLQSALAHIK